MAAASGPQVRARIDAVRNELETGRAFEFSDCAIGNLVFAGSYLLFEALASGKPIVATDADGLMDVLTDRRDARLVPKRDAAALADAIIDLMDDPDERAGLAAAARVTAERYDITAFVRKMEQFYVRLTNGSPGDLSFLEDRGEEPPRLTDEPRAALGDGAPQASGEKRGGGAPATKQ